MSALLIRSVSSECFLVESYTLTAHVQSMLFR